MGRAYSLDLRERVVAAVAAGESCRTVAATFKVSVASVVKWSQRFRATGSAAARPMGGNRPRAARHPGRRCQASSPRLKLNGWRAGTHNDGDTPPDTGKRWPVMKLASSLQRNSAALAISRG